MERKFNNIEFGRYLKQTLGEYICHLERNPITDEQIFEYRKDILIEKWEKSFNDIVNKKFYLLCKGVQIERSKIAKTIVRQWLKDKEDASVEYVNNRVEILKEDLSELCSEILDKYYI